MSMQVPAATSQPMVVSGATRSMAAPSSDWGNMGSQVSATNVDFSSMLQSLIQTLGQSGNGSTGSNINTYV